MEIITKLYNIQDINKYYEAGTDGFIIGGPFSFLFDFTTEEIGKIVSFCNRKLIDVYIQIDRIIHQSEIEDLYSYLDYLFSININGIYFTDLAVLDYGKIHGKENLLIYNSDKMMCNTLDKTLFLSLGLKGVVLTNELNFDELTSLLSFEANKNDLQIAGHQLISATRKYFLRDYFNEVGIQRNTLNVSNFTIQENNRQYKMPIIERSSGTLIFSDFFYLLTDEMPYLKNVVKRGIIETCFVDSELISDVIKCYKNINNDNKVMFKKTLLSKYNNINFTSGYLYEEMTDKKAV